MKGISTVIATLLMLVITVALAMLAYSYINTLVTGKTGKIVELDPDLTTCTGSGATRQVTAYIKNSGTIDFLASTVTIARQGGSVTGACTTGTTSVQASGAPVSCTALISSELTAGPNTITAYANARDGPSNVAKTIVSCS